MPTYANHLFRYDHYDDRGAHDGEVAVKSTARRSQRTAKRRSRKRTAGLTVNARRNRRWAW